MTALERRMLTLALLLGMVTLSIATGRWLGRDVLPVPVAHAATGSFYGANEDMAYYAAAADWPQKDPNWCGVANIEMIANYTYEAFAHNSLYRPFQSGGQQRIANDLNSAAAVSQWGSAYPSGGGFKADIALDGGTDPRSIAWGILYESTAGNYLHTHRRGELPPRWATRTFSFHNAIYYNDVAGALSLLAYNLDGYHIPVSVTIAHGLHSDVVSGVYANQDPRASYPATVDAVNTWDPDVGTADGGYQSAREVTWDNYTFNTNPSMWGSTYSANGGYDPDPSVGLYTPNSTYPTHWIGNRTAIVPDSLTNVSVDYAVDGYGNVLYHP